MAVDEILPTHHYSKEYPSNPVEEKNKKASNSIKDESDLLITESSSSSQLLKENRSKEDKLSEDVPEIITTTGDDQGEEEEEVNEEYDDEDTDDGHEAFEAFKPKVIKLCHEIGYGEPTEIEEMAGGSYHRIVGLKFNSREHENYVLRVPWLAWLEEETNEICDQISVLQFLHQFDFLKTSLIVAYDATINNPLERQYVLQTRLRGQTIQNTYYHLPLDEKLEITTLVAELVIKMESIKFDTPGRLIGKQDLPFKSATPPLTSSINITGFRQRTWKEMPPTECQPIASFLHSLLQNQYEYEKSSWPQAAKWCLEFQDMVTQMEAAGLIHFSDVHNILWHWDFAARNILIECVSTPDGKAENSVATEPLNCKHIELKLPSKDSHPRWKITGVVDWDDVMSVPLVLSRQPPTWLWFNEDDRELWYGNNDAKPHRDLTAEELLIKAHFDQIMSNASTSYIEDAYHRGPWLRAVFKVGRDGFFSNVERTLAKELRAKWAEYWEEISLLNKSEFEGSEPERSDSEHDTSDLDEVAQSDEDVR